MSRGPFCSAPAYRAFSQLLLNFFLRTILKKAGIIIPIFRWGNRFRVGKQFAQSHTDYCYNTEFLAPIFVFPLLYPAASTHLKKCLSYWLFISGMVWTRMEEDEEKILIVRTLATLSCWQLWLWVKCCHLSNLIRATLTECMLWASRHCARQEIGATLIHEFYYENFQANRKIERIRQWTLIYSPSTLHKY